MTIARTTMTRIDTFYDDLATCHPTIVRGQVWCRSCGATQRVQPEECFRSGWPKCCGYTMTLDSPEEQAR